jgi:hypothetical protein
MIRSMAKESIYSNTAGFNLVASMSEGMSEGLQMLGNPIFTIARRPRERVNELGFLRHSFFEYAQKPPAPRTNISLTLPHSESFCLQTIASILTPMPIIMAIFKKMVGLLLGLPAYLNPTIKILKKVLNILNGL